ILKFIKLKDKESTQYFFSCKMENIQIFKYCPWVTEEINVQMYFEKYNMLLDEVNGMKPHNEEINKEEALREFFHMPDDMEAPYSRRSTPALSMHGRTLSTDSNETGLTKFSKGALRSLSIPSDIYSSDDRYPLRSKSANDIEDESDANNELDYSQNDPFALQKMEEDCSIDLLTVEGELPSSDISESRAISDTGRITNWYAGSFMDGVIPDGGPEKLVTLAMQAKELYKRETVKDYTRLRHRLLKYSSTVVKKENSPENMPLEESISSSSLRDIVFNVRIHSPFHRRSYQKKGSNRYPKHSQEMYLLGSQKLTDLKDAIVCMNDVYVHEDMSKNPDLSICLNFPCSQELFRSSFFYINGTFYSDMRHPDAVDNSETIRTWAKKYPLIGEMKIVRMEDTKLEDLSLRLGYPYVYQHLGNCEHLITFTDVRLHHCTDISDPSKYPLSRGNPIKLSVFCYSCNLYLANWVVKDDPRLPKPIAHFCDKCLKLFGYNDN
ncbi:snRNA-activating protein complex subunit 3, partial [Armadillidium nasatum]